MKIRSIGTKAQSRRSSRNRLAMEVLETRIYLTVFQLHSNPGADHTIYLDFDGHVTQGTTWNSNYGITTINSPPYDIDGNPSVFGATELARIEDVWEIVSEDFIPFDVNVTTEEPGPDALRKSGSGDTQWGVRVVITDDTFANCGCGGHAYIGSFDDTQDEPVFVYNSSLTGVAEASSHEVGHAMWLSHDGTSTATYYSGHGSGNTSWGPLMGASYNRNVTHWSKGEYYDSNNAGSGANYGNGPDDLAIIASLTNGNGFGYRSDDHGDNAASATALDVAGLNVSGNGIIETTADDDVFSFVTGTGTVQLDIDTVAQGTNLDIRAELRDNNGSLVATSDDGSVLDAGFNISLAGGQYTLHITGTGTGNPHVSSPSGYTEYGSLGRYFISGTIVDPDPDTAIVTVQATDDSAAEAGQDPGVFTISRTGDLSSPLTVLYSMSGDADNGTDYTQVSGSVTIPINQPSATVTITPSDDSTPEGSEQAILTIDPDAAYVIGAANSAIVSIADDDLTSVDDAAISETTIDGSVVTGSYPNTHTDDDSYEEIEEELYGGGKRTRMQHQWTFNVTGGNSVTFFAQAHHDGGPDDFDFEYSTDGVSWTKMFTVTKTADGDVPQSYDLPASTSGTLFVRVIDTNRVRNENAVNRIWVDQLIVRSHVGGGTPLPTVSVTTTDSSAAEQDSDPGEFTVTRSGSTSGDLVVNYSMSGADNGTDYNLLSGSVTIASGSSSATVQVVPIDDAFSEGNENVTLTLVADAAYTLTAPSNASLTIVDNDVSATDDFAQSEVSVYGSQAGTLANTFSDDDVYKSITEELFAGNKRSRAQHEWTFHVTGGNTVTFHVSAYHNSSVEDFEFQYSIDNGSSWASLLTVTDSSDSDITQTNPLPNGTSGTVLIRIVDTDRSKDSSLDTIFIDEMFIRSDNSGAPESPLAEAEIIDPIWFFEGPEGHVHHHHHHDHHHDHDHIGHELGSHGHDEPFAGGLRVETVDGSPLTGLNAKQSTSLGRGVSDDVDARIQDPLLVNLVKGRVAANRAAGRSIAIDAASTADNSTLPVEIVDELMATEGIGL